MITALALVLVTFALGVWAGVFYERLSWERLVNQAVAKRREKRTVARRASGHGTVKKRSRAKREGAQCIGFMDDDDAMGGM